METIHQMRERHKKEIEELQKNCSHPKLSEWREEWWAIGHSTGHSVKVCELCGKVVKRKKQLPECEGEHEPKWSSIEEIKTPKPLRASYPDKKRNVKEE